VTNINGDGLEDVFIGSSKGNQKAMPRGQEEICLGTAGNSKGLLVEDIDACWVDLNRDGKPDLVVASGGNEFYGEDLHLSPRVYLNDGHANLQSTRCISWHLCECILCGFLMF
jgi:hypothetical protein